MTSIVKKCLLAAFVAAGLVASGSSASASFQFTYTPTSGNAGVATNLINVASPAGTTNFVSNPAPPGAAITLLDPNGAGAGRLITISWDITDRPTQGGITVNNITLQYNGTVASAPISFRLEIVENQGSIPASLGNDLTAQATFVVFGGTDQTGPFNPATTSTATPLAQISQTGQSPNPLSVTFPFPIPNLPLGTVPLVPGGLGSPPFSVNFTRGTSGPVTTRLVVDVQLQGYTNVTIQGSISVLANTVPAPAGLVLAGLGLPALGLATRLRRKVVA